MMLLWRRLEWLLFTSGRLIVFSLLSKTWHILLLYYFLVFGMHYGDTLGHRTGEFNSSNYYPIYKPEGP
jgi:hypothetical protein